MDDLIRRQDVIEVIKQFSTDNIRLRNGLMELANHMELIPSVDAVEVVRCKYCRWGKEACGNIECFVDSNIPTEYHGYEWFCPNGERREE